MHKEACRDRAKAEFFQIAVLLKLRQFERRPGMPNFSRMAVRTRMAYTTPKMELTIMTRAQKPRVRVAATQAATRINFTSHPHGV